MTNERAVRACSILLVSVLACVAAAATFRIVTAAPAEALPIGVAFDRIVIDENPPTTLVEKAIADLDGDGRADVVIGSGWPSRAGIFWYRNPPSGNMTGTWTKHVIVPGGSAYEDMIAQDVNGDGALDIIASHDLKVKWFENPRGRGESAMSGQWIQHIIGQAEGENNMVLVDFDGDGVLDLATNKYVYFKNGPDSWTEKDYGRLGNGVTNLDALTGHAAVNLVGMSPRWPGRIVWFENPMAWGGSPRTDEWRTFEIGPAYGTQDTFLTYASADLNWDGRMDLVTARSEGDENPPIGELVWWEAPEDYHSGEWIKHVIDPTYTSAHNIRMADMNSDGATDIVTAEQEQSPRDRVSVFFNDGTGSFTELVLSTGSGHNVAVEDLDGDGDMDVLNAGHGFYDAPHPVEIYVNRPL